MLQPLSSKDSLFIGESRFPSLVEKIAFNTFD